MAWNKTKQHLNEFLAPNLQNIIQYKPYGYRYNKDKSTNCYIVVNGKDIMNMNNPSTGILWFQNDQEAKKDSTLHPIITASNIDALRKSSAGKIPEERLYTIALNKLKSEYAKNVMDAQKNLVKIDFQQKASTFMTTSIEDNLNSNDIILNILAIIDRRVGKGRLKKLKPIMMMKHPAVRYFYDLRLNQ